MSFRSDLSIKMLGWHRPVKIEFICYRCEKSFVLWRQGKSKDIEFLKQSMWNKEVDSCKRSIQPTLFGYFGSGRLSHRPKSLVKMYSVRLWMTKSDDTMDNHKSVQVPHCSRSWIETQILKLPGQWRVELIWKTAHLIEKSTVYWWPSINTICSIRWWFQQPTEYVTVDDMIPTCYWQGTVSFHIWLTKHGLYLLAKLKKA